jgi:hypothetical protein
MGTSDTVAMTIMRKTARSALVVLALIGVARADAAVVLGFHEAQLIAERTPGFLEAVKRGLCPQISDGILNGQIATIIIRTGCGDYGSGYILGVYVDVRTGVVTKDSGAPGGVE